MSYGGRKQGGSGKYVNVGALWKKKTGEGKTFLSGSFQLGGKDSPKLTISIFPNDYKEKDGDQAPDYKITAQRESNGKYLGVEAFLAAVSGGGSGSASGDDIPF